MGKMLKNEVAKNELKEVRHSEEWHKSGEKVKYRLADAMKSCMKKAPVEKITVKEITEECGVSRQTFYRNFQDKYDLINWFKAAFKNDTQNCLRDHDFELIREFYKNQIEEKSGKTMSEHLQFQLEMYCQGSIYMTVQWVLGEMKESPENLAHALAQSMPEELAKVFRELEML